LLRCTCALRAQQSHITAKVGDVATDCAAAAAAGLLKLVGSEDELAAVLAHEVSIDLPTKHIK
jgi:hypothetical protein